MYCKNHVIWESKGGFISTYQQVIIIIVEKQVWMKKNSHGFLSCLSHIITSEQCHCQQFFLLIKLASVLQVIFSNNLTSCIKVVILYQKKLNAQSKCLLLQQQYKALFGNKIFILYLMLKRKAQSYFLEYEKTTWMFNIHIFQHFTIEVSLAQVSVFFSEECYSCGNKR